MLGVMGVVTIDTGHVMVPAAGCSALTSRGTNRAIVFAAKLLSLYLFRLCGKLQTIFYSYGIKEQALSVHEVPLTLSLRED